LIAVQPRIAMLSVHSCPIGDLGARDTGGMSVYVRELARELGKQGLAVDVYTRAHQPGHSQIVELGQQARLIHLGAGEGVKMDKLAVYPHLPDFARNLESFRRRNHLNYDLVFSHYWLSGWVGRYLERRWHVPHIIVFHTLGAVKNAIGVGEKEPALRLRTEAQLAQDCHGIIATTRREKDDLIRHYGAAAPRIRVIPCGVNLDLFRPMNREVVRRELGFNGDRDLLFVGRIEPLKGIDRLLEALRYLQNGHRIKLWVIGGDESSRDEVARLQKLSQALGIADAVKFLGMVEHEKLPYFYNAAAACIIPSYYESFSLVALEALACGTPVVASNVGGIRNFIRQGETGYMVKNGNPHHLADQIARLLSRPATKPALSIRESVNRFSWSNMAEQVSREVLADYLAGVN